MWPRLEQDTCWSYKGCESLSFLACHDTGCAHFHQGIKFYDPEIVGDTPETVELVGVRNLLEAVGERLGCTAGKTIFATDGSVGA